MSDLSAAIASRAPADQAQTQEIDKMTAASS